MYVREADWETAWDRGVDADEDTEQPLKAAKDDLLKNDVPNIVGASRLRQHLVNVASGEAVIRYLANGELPDDDTFTITAADVRHAKDLLQQVFDTYTGGDADGRRSKVMQLPQDAYEVYRVLKTHHLEHDEKYAKKLTVDTLTDRVDLNDADIGTVQDICISLVEQGLAVMSGNEVMWMPELSYKLEKGLEEVREGGSIPKSENWIFKKLSQHGLVSYDDGRGQYYLWAGDDDDPAESPQSAKDQIRDLLSPEGVGYTELYDRVDASEDVIDDAIEELLRTDECYEDKGRFKPLG
jgi:hypothetical protein